MLDTPRAAAAFANGIAFTDANNARARAVATDGTISTVADLGATVTPTLALSGSPSIVYGTGSLTATFANQGLTATGTVTLLEGTNARGVGHF